MIGIPVRIQRGGQWVTVEIEDMSDAERATLFANNDHDMLLRWIHVLCGVIARLKTGGGKELS